MLPSGSSKLSWKIPGGFFLATLDQAAATPAQGGRRPLLGCAQVAHGDQHGACVAVKAASADVFKCEKWQRTNYNRI
jgi:hypothetical protein